MFKKNYLVSTLFCFLIFSPNLFADNLSVAFVNIQRVLNESPQISDLKRRVTDDFSDREKRIEKMQIKIKLLEKKLEKDGKKMTSMEQRRLKHDISTRRLKRKHARDEIKQDKQLRYSEEEEKVTRIIEEVIAQVAQDEKIDIVLQSGVLWFSPKADITDKVLSQLKQLSKTKK
tara:strand:- start:237 stop:758 length:522 start_codon:yes stop_codon:yes gene_type:complete